MQYNIVVKVKKGHKIKESIVTKNLILNLDHFVEDTSDWSKVFEHLYQKKK